jgi:FtsP/CotA-like multicopper oxidase with cupredoxin domain
MGRKMTRRGMLATGAAAAPALAALHETIPHDGLHRALGGHQDATAAAAMGHGGEMSHGGMAGGLAMHDAFKGTVDVEANGFDPSELVRDFDGGRTSTLPDGRTLREWTILAEDKDIEVAPGVTYPAWTYNGRVPGPTLRARQGERLRIRFVNGSDHPHTMHFHGIHPDFMDGMPGIGEGRGGGQIDGGQVFEYEFDAEPFGVHLYHCHAMPLAAHIAKGLYGAFIIDPADGREPADELVMVMNGFDTDFDGENDIYAVNSIPFHYVERPIKVKRGELVRIYLINALEYDPLNSFHIHANFFDYYPTGTRLEPTEYTDTIVQGQAQRGVLELRFPYAGHFMFHAHKTEFAELGWLGFFEVEE